MQHILLHGGMDETYDPRDRTQSVDLAHALISHGKCAVLVLR